MSAKHSETLLKYDEIVDENRSLKGKIEFMNQKIGNIERENAKLYK